MLYFTSEVFRRLANQNRGYIRVMLEYVLSYLLSYLPAYCDKKGSDSRTELKNNSPNIRNDHVYAKLTTSSSKITNVLLILSER